MKMAPVPRCRSQGKALQGTKPPPRPFVCDTMFLPGRRAGAEAAAAGGGSRTPTILFFIVFRLVTFGCHPSRSPDGWVGRNVAPELGLGAGAAGSAPPQRPIGCRDLPARGAQRQPGSGLKLLQLNKGKRCI